MNLAFHGYGFSQFPRCRMLEKEQCSLLSPLMLSTVVDSHSLFVSILDTPQPHPITRITGMCCGSELHLPHLCVVCHSFLYHSFWLRVDIGKLVNNWSLRPAPSSLSMNSFLSAYYNKDTLCYCSMFYLLI